MRRLVIVGVDCRTGRRESLWDEDEEQEGKLCSTENGNVLNFYPVLTVIMFLNSFYRVFEIYTD